ncbi:MAG: hypothetical protein Q9214_000180, partial [Letrouitia sp. 1 TL-2023]
EPETVERLWQDKEDSVYYDESSPNPEQGLHKKYAIGAPSAPVGWTSVVDAMLKDDLATARGYFSIKWRRCAVKIPKDPKLLGPDDLKVTTTRGIQEIFSYYGALGMRVFAPVKKGDYSAWQLVTQVPFLGQTSRGTGKTVGGNWNSASILSYGAENEFGDINEWNRTYSNWKHFNDMDTWEKLEHGYGTKTAKGWEWKGRPYKPQ